jgi:hypothetical protein
MEKLRQQRKAENSSKPCSWICGRGEVEERIIRKSDGPGDRLAVLAEEEASPHLLQALNPNLGFGETAAALMWKASLGEERHSLALLITEGDSKAPS